MNSMLEKLRQWHEKQLYGFQSNETRRLPYVMVIIQ